MIILIATRENAAVAGGVELTVIGPYEAEPEAAVDARLAEQAGFRVSAYVVEDPAEFRETLGLTL